MDKRTLAANLLLGALLFVGVAHAVLAAFLVDTGLADVGLLLVGVVLLLLVVVNL